MEIFQQNSFLSKHIKLHSSQVILSRSFCNFDKYSSYTSFEKDFNNELCKLLQTRRVFEFLWRCFYNSIIEVTENKIIDKSKENVNV